MDDVEQRINAVLQKRFGKKKRSKYFNYILLFVVMASLGTVIALPFFDDKSLLSHVQTILESKENNNPLVAALPLNGSAYDYWYAPPGSFGINQTKTVNFTFWKSWLKKYFSYELEARQNNESSWQNANELLNVSLLFNQTNNTCKITLTLNTTNAPVALYYRFTLVANRSVISHINKSANYTYVLNLSANQTENYSLVYNYSDLAPYIQSGVINIKQGIWNNYFYQRIKTNKKIAVGKTVVIDPTFGETGIVSGSTTVIDNYIHGNYGTPNSSGTADNISWYGRARGDIKVKACLYLNSTKAKVGETAERVMYYNASYLWNTLYFDEPKPSVSSGVSYIVVVWGNTSVGDSSAMPLGTTAGVDSFWRDAENYDGASGVFPDPTVGSFLANRQMSIYCSYTVSGASKSWQSNYSGYLTGGNITEYVQEYSGYLTGGNITDTWVSDYSGYLTGGNTTVTWQSNYSGWLTGGNNSDWIQNYTGWLSGGNDSDWQQNYSGYLTGGNATVTWQSNYSGYLTGGNATVTWQSNYSGWLTGGNGTVAKTWQSNYSGYLTGGNTTDWVQNYSGYLTGGNVSRTWQQNYTGWLTGGNVTVDAFNITLEFPINESNIYSVQPTVYFNLTHPNGYTMNYSLYIDNTTLVYSGVNVSNGTQVNTDHLFYSANTTYVDYYWKVVVNDGMGNWVNETFTFQAILQGGGGITGYGAALAIATGAIMLSVVGLIGINEKKKRRGRI